MRIVAGDLRGKTIDAPAGENTRPTIDRVREALFSSLYSLRGGFEGAVVLDAFAGSGALGLEALSRGAERAVFFESDEKACSVLRRNIAACKLEEPRAQVMRRDVLKVDPPRTGGPFDLVFLDPPYSYDADIVLARMSSLATSSHIADDAIVAYEHALKARDAVAHAADANGFEVIASRKYGKTAVTTMRPLRNHSLGSPDRPPRSAAGN